MKFLEYNVNLQPKSIMSKRFESNYVTLSQRSTMSNTRNTINLFYLTVLKDFEY